MMKRMWLLVVLAVISSPSFGEWFFRGTASNWATVALSASGGSSYTTCQKFTTSSAGGVSRFKIDRYGDWKESYPSSDVVVSDNTSYQITFNSSTKAISTSIVASCESSNTGFQHVLPQLKIRGTFNAWTAAPMKLVADYTWQTDIVLDNQTNQRFKFDVNGDWVQNYGDTGADGILDLSGSDIFVSGSGNYRATVNDQTKRFSLTKLDNQNLAPVAIISPVGPLSVKVGESVTLSAAGSTDSDGSVVSYKWSNGDSTATTKFSSLIAGSYTVSVTVADDKGATSSKDIQINVIAEPTNVAPKAVITASGSQSIKVGESLSLSASSSTDTDGSIVSYKWDNGNSTASNTFSSTSAGTFTVTLTVTDDKGATNTSSMTITVSENTPAAWYFRGTSNDWGKTAMSSSDGITYCTRQSFGSTNPRFKIDHYGDWKESYPSADYTVSANTTYDICFKTTTKQFDVKVVIPEVNQSPKAVINPAGPLSIKIGESVSLNATGSSDADGTIASYKWSDGSTASTTKFTSTAAGTFTVTLTVTDNKGATGTATVTITVTKETISDTWHYRGDSNDWVPVKMTVQDGGSRHCTRQLFRHLDTRFKIDHFGDWKESYPATDKIVTADRTYDICFDASTKSITVTDVIPDEKDIWYFRGQPNDWTSTAMERASATSFCTTQTFGLSDPRYQIDHFGDWKETYPMTARVLEPRRTYEICFNAVTKEITEKLIRVENTPPIVNDGSDQVENGKSVTLTLYGRDNESDPLTYKIVTGPTHGSLSQVDETHYLYTSDADYHGVDNVTFVANDGRADSSAANIKLTVYVKPIAKSKLIKTPEDTPTNITVDVSDPLSRELNYSISKYPSHGRLIGDGPTYRYEPMPNYNGSDSFTYSARAGYDYLAISDTTVLDIVVEAVPDVPKIISRPVTKASVGLLYQYQVVAEDVDNDHLTYQLISAPDGMTISATGLISWQPQAATPTQTQVKVIVEDPSGLSAEQAYFLLHSLSDEDGDGVADAQDLCAQTITEDDVDSSGCSAVQLDTKSYTRSSTVPQTGSKQTLTDFDDGSLRWGKPRKYERDSSLDVVVDRVNNLTWLDTEDTANLKLTGAQAKDYCDGLSYAGVDNWRLPSLIELSYLLDHQGNGKGSYIDKAFRNISSGGNGVARYLAAESEDISFNISRDVIHTINYVVDFDSAIVSEPLRIADDFYYKNPLFPVRCVSGNKSASSPDFSNTSNGLFDRANNLVWQNVDLERLSEVTWPEAVEACHKLSIFGKSDWRLPNINELNLFYSLDYDDYMAKRLDAYGDFWSSTLTPDKKSSHVRALYKAGSNSGYAYGVVLNSHYISSHTTPDNSYKPETLYSKNSARCVRDYSTPVAVSGGNRTLAMGKLYQLDGSASHQDDGNALTYRWVHHGSISGDRVLGTENILPLDLRTYNLGSENSHNYPIDSTQKFSLTVTDSNGFSNTEFFTIHFTDAPPPSPPIANAGGNQRQPFGKVVVLDGSASNITDSYYPITTYKWYMDNVLVGTGIRRELSNLPVGSHTVELRVSNASGLSSSDTIKIDIYDYVPPHSHAGDDVHLSDTANVVLDASNSTAGDNPIIRYEWYLNGQLVGEGKSLQLPPMAPGEYQFDLVSWDSLGVSGRDTVTITISDLPPVAVATKVASIREGEALKLNGSQSHDDHALTQYAWYVDNQLVSQTPSSVVNNLLLGAHTVKLVVTDSNQVSAEDGFTVKVNAAFEHCLINSTDDDSNLTPDAPDADIPWQGGDVKSVQAIANAFNYARKADSSAKRYLIMPAQDVWDRMSVQQKGLYLVNSERIARGLKPYSGFDESVVGVAQQYADYILSNNQVIGHYNDGNSPLGRLMSNPFIAKYADKHIEKPESVFSSSQSKPGIDESFAVARAIYAWLYEDKNWFVDFGMADGEAWGHRNHILQVNLNDNNGDSSHEGIAGFGVSLGLYQPGQTLPQYHGAVVVFNTIDQGGNWPGENISSVDVSQSTGCIPYRLDVHDSADNLKDITRITVQPGTVHLAVGQTAELSVTGWRGDGTNLDLTQQAVFEADSYAAITIEKGSISALHAGLATVYAKVGNIESNRLYVSVGMPSDTSNLDGTRAEDLIPHIADNATEQELDPMSLAVFTGQVGSKDGSPLSGVQIGFLGKPDFGSVTTDDNGRFIITGPAGKQTLVYEMADYLVAQRTTIAASTSWAILDTVTLLPRDSKQTWIHLGGDEPQIHQSSIVSDEFGERQATVVFNHINSAVIRSADGTERPIEEFMFSATEFETPKSMPGELPNETAFTWASDLHVEGTHYSDSVYFDGYVVMFLDNFLNFDVGEIVPIGYYDRVHAQWKSSSNGVVVQLVDGNHDGVVDGLDYTGDGIADDVDGSGSSADDAVGVSQYPPGKTLWWGRFEHMTPLDYNWSVAQDGISPIITVWDGRERTDKGCGECVSSYIYPKSLELHEDIDVPGTGLTLHYSSQRTHGFHHEIRVNVSGDSTPAGLLSMQAVLEIGGVRFEQKFDPLPNQQAIFYWDGKDPTGKDIEGVVRGRLSVGYEYATAYLSAGNAATSGRALSSYPLAWAKTGATATEVSSREPLRLWSNSVVTTYNPPANTIANGWSLSNYHQSTPYNLIYMGDGSVMTVDKGNTVLKTGITQSQQVGDDGYYQKGGQDIDYRIDDQGVLHDLVTGLQWQYVSGTPAYFMTNSQAATYCRNLQLGEPGQKWRLPTSKELAYGIDKSASGFGYIIHQAGALLLWSSSSVNPENNKINAICVSGEKLDTKHAKGLVRSDNREVVVDEDNGLMWQDSADNLNIKLNWSEAIGYCEELDHAGYDDWRLPNINELTYALPNSSFNNQTELDFPNGEYWTWDVHFRKPYWTSTPNALAPDTQAWAIESEGWAYHEHDKKANTYNVRCVRDDMSHARSPYLFDEKGRHARTIDVTSGITLTTFEYDKAGQLSAMKDQFGNRILIHRDENEQVTSIQAPFGQVTTLDVDDNQDLRSVEYEDGSSQWFTYVNSLMTEQKKPNGNIFYRAFNEHGRIIQSRDPEGGKWDFFSDIDPEENILHYGFNTIEGRSSKTSLQTTTAGDEHEVTTREDGSTYEQSTSADKLHQSSVENGVQTTVDNVIDRRSKQPIPSVMTTTLPSGLKNEVHVSKVYGDGGTDTSLYSISATSNGNTSQLTNNGKTGAAKFTSAANRTHMLNTDPASGLLRSSVVSGLNTTNYEFDARGRLITTQFGDRLTSYAYDDAFGKGQLTAITNAVGQTTRFDYDVMGRVNKITYPDGRVLTKSYDFEGNLLSLTPPGRSEHLFHYNSVGRTTDYVPPTLTEVSNPVTDYVYDRDRKLTSITRPDGQQLVYAYKPGATLLDKLVTPLGSYQYGYNNNQQLTQVVAPSGDALSTSYDGHLVTGQQWSGVVRGAVAWEYNSDFAVKRQCVNGDCIDVSYDADGLVTQVGALAITREAQKSGMIAGATVGRLSMTRSNNEYGEADAEQHSFSGNPLLSASYGRDLLGRIVSRNLSILGSSVDEGFHYDVAGRLDQVTRGDTMVSYQYDSNGNRLAKTTQTDKATTTIYATYDDQDRLLAYGDCRYAYTANGELKSKRCGDKLTQYDYDVLGNLRKVVLPGDTPSVIEYVIDGQQRRIGKKVNGVLRQGWLYGDQLNPIAELDGNNNVVSRFVYGTQGHVPDYMVKDGVVYRYITDHLGSARLIVNVASGEVAQQLDYDEFGMITRDTNPGFQPFGYAGGIYEVSSGLTRFGFRDYDAESGRWTSKDPIGFDGGDSDLYAYVGSNPFQNIDPNGLATAKEINTALDTIRNIVPSIYPEMPTSVTPVANLQSWYGPELLGYTDLSGNIQINADVFGDSSTSVPKYREKMFLWTIAHEWIHVQQGFFEMLLSHGELHEQIDKNAESIADMALEQYMKKINCK
jgi:RHS repeat-associated protein